MKIIYCISISLLLLLGACATIEPVTRPGETPQTPQLPPSAQNTTVGGGRYESVAGRGAEAIAELRAAPPPAQPEFSDGTTPDGDEHTLVAKGFVRIGDGYFATSDAAARSWALSQGQRVGAEKALVYNDAGNAAAPFRVAFYVRYRLPFGASFRDATADEQQLLGATGVQLGTIVGGTPASEANLRAGDFVLKFNGKPVTNRAAFQDMLRANMGKRVTLSINRDGVMFDRLLLLGMLATESQGAK